MRFLHRVALVAACLGLVVSLPVAAQPEPKRQPTARRDPRPVDDPDWMFEVLERVREKYHVPSLSAAVLIDGRVVAASAAGRRKADDPTPVKRTDRYLIGSVSKPITATLISVLVEKGVLSFDDTLEKMFPELADTMHPDYRMATVAQLLAHTAGLPYQPTKHESHERFKDLEVAVKNRYEYVKNALADKGVAKPGEKFEYSGGAVIAAHYAERLTKKPVEELLEEHVYRPLGWAGTDHVNVTSGLDQVDGPWPHDLTDGKLIPRPPHGEHGKSRLPVGGVCCSMTDLARLLGTHLPQPKSPYPGTRLLKAETLKRLHAVQPPGSSTMSWYPSGADWTRELVLWHSGSTGGWFCLAHLVPGEGYATCVAVNANGKDCDQACQQAHLELVKRVPRLRERAAANWGAFPPDRVPPDRVPARPPGR
ncbi:MAG TPA: serine hydrolase domain-containing protein [Urbifossiella sp.]|nr:serine hydrolase domain-containing protein [Urbifossiella sp.]